MKLHLPLYVFLCLAFSAQSQTATQIWTKMSAAMAKVNTITYELSVQERFGDKQVTKVADFRLQAAPFKVYGKNKNSGIEFLYVEGWNSNKAYVNPNGAPWINLSLDIYGQRIRDENHHTINHTGFAYMLGLLKRLETDLTKRGLSLESRWKYGGELTWNNVACYRLQMEEPDYKIITHTCTKDETLFELCEREKWLEYGIMEANKLSFGAKVTKGQVLKVPNYLAKKIVLYIDKSTHLPIVQMIYDDKGLYEKYEYRNLVLNPKLHGAEWTTQCAGYGF